MQPLRIGISIGLHQNDESIWSNGIKQNALFLAKVLQASPAKHQVVLLNTTTADREEKLAWDREEFETQNFQQFLRSNGMLDVFIELGGQISPEDMLKLKETGCKTVSYCCGVEYLFLMEKMVNGIECWTSGLLVNPHFDQIWCIPQVAEHSAPFLETLRRAPAFKVPFVWDPMFVEQRGKDFPNDGVYQPRGDKPKRLSVMEPNMNIVKTAIFPILIAERAYREAPNEIEFLYVTNGINWAKHSKDFNHLMSNMDIVHGHKATFIERYDTPQFLSTQTDIVISHQLLNPLNYFYFDTAWQGYPILHNAYLCEEIGYFYNQSDVGAAAQKLLWIMRNHDSIHEQYKANQRAELLKYTSKNPELVRQYDDLLAGLVHG